jgi:2',3'-cyclic-nucleotide 2'-phosphodiesterase (5'-nucleotidase family)
MIAVADAFWEGYAVARLTYDLAAGRIVQRTVETVQVATPSDAQVAYDPGLQALVARWQARETTALGEVIGHTATGLDTQSAALHNLLVDSWLWAYPQAQVAVSNVGGFRQGLDAGDVTLGDIVGTLPFDNYLLEVELTGADVLRLVNEWSTDLVFGGLRRGADGRVALADGAPLSTSARYRVLVLDYVYGNARYPFQGMDASPYETGIPWRQPAIDWLRLQRTTRDWPLERVLNPQPQP